MQSFFKGTVTANGIDRSVGTAKVIDRKSHIDPGKLRITEWLFEVPLDHRNPDGGSLRLFARDCHCMLDQEDPELPWLLYLQGGPGLGCRTPLEYAWLPAVLEKGYRVLFLDARGTGQSSTITAQTLGLQGDTTKQVEYIKKFRADNIARDCEAIRRTIPGNSPIPDRKWSLLGASFGGFISISYVSLFPEGLVEVFIGGGPCPLVREPVEVVPLLFEVAARRNEVYYKKYPEDVERVKTIIEYLSKNKVAMSAGTLTPTRFQQLGLMLGLHDVVQRANNDLEMFSFLTGPTLSTIEGFGMANNVIYSLLQEPMYCQGKPGQWCADRCRQRDRRFSLSRGQSPIFFTGEAVFSDMFESYNELKGLKEVANQLARNNSWSHIYDEAQLAKNEVPVYVATAVEDMYVAYELANQTARKVKGLKQVINNTWYHDAIESKAGEVMPALFALKEDTID
ncbi:prolyl aminopeptidase [Penicillium herquei]|nr:prolyl aminopeptidase [Penicillium herquei]